jgi:hypothetical protein
MLDHPTDLTLWERDKIKLDFALFVAKRARRFHADPAQIIGVISGRLSEDIAHLFSLEGATEKAAGTPPAGGSRPDSPASITEAPKPLPADTDEARRPAEAKTSDQEPSVSDGSGGMQDGLPVHPATLSPAGKPVGPSGSTAPLHCAASRPGAPATRAFVIPENEESERTAKRVEIAALHDAEPWLSPEVAAARVLIPVVNLRIFSQELDIEWSKPRALSSIAAPAISSDRRTLREKVSSMHAMHPTWTARLIANELGAPFSSVSTYLGEVRRQARAGA